MSLEHWLDVLAEPGAGAPLRVEGGALVSAGGARFALSETGVPSFAAPAEGSDARQQQEHYDRIAHDYMVNLGYPHTQEYMALLDDALLKAAGSGSLGTVAELCCGHGEALGLKALKFDRYVGVDISTKMLEQGRAAAPDRDDILFVQGDATRTPIRDGSVDTVLILGGVHHVPDRLALFSEVRRILKPGGRLIFREPVSDFVLWKALRWVVYRASPMLDHTTERPLVYEETAPVLEAAGLRLSRYDTHGLFGFCLFMNSDVLVFNRLFRFIPGIRAITRGVGRLDEALLRLPMMRRAGLQVVGEATAP